MLPRTPTQILAPRQTKFTMPMVGHFAREAAFNLILFGSRTSTSIFTDRVLTHPTEEARCILK